MNTLIVTKGEAVEFKKSEGDIVDVLKSYIAEDPILSSNTHYLQSGTHGLMDYLVALQSNGYSAYFIPNEDVDETMKYFLIREGIAVVDGKPIRGRYKLLGELDDNSEYKDYVKSLQGINEDVNVVRFLSSIKNWDIIDITIVAAIPEIKALMDITNTKLIMNTSADNDEDSVLID